MSATVSILVVFTLSNVATALAVAWIIHCFRPGNRSPLPHLPRRSAPIEEPADENPPKPRTPVKL
jgi:hypothetical protein